MHRVHFLIFYPAVGSFSRLKAFVFYKCFVNLFHSKSRAEIYTETVECGKQARKKGKGIYTFLED